MLIRVIWGRSRYRPLFLAFMDKKMKSNKIPSGSGYLLGLVFGVAIMVTFSVVLGAAFFGIMLGLSFSLSIGIAFECTLAGDKHLPLFQKVMLSMSVVLLALSVVSLLLWDGI